MSRLDKTLAWWLTCIVLTVLGAVITVLFLEGLDSSKAKNYDVKVESSYKLDGSHQHVFLVTSGDTRVYRVRTGDFWMENGTCYRVLMYKSGGIYAPKAVDKIKCKKEKEHE